MVSKEMLQLGTARSVIRELFEYGKARAEIVGADKVYDFSLGNPNTLPPNEINEKAISLLQEHKTIHSYTSASGDLGARTRFAEEISRKSGKEYAPEHLYLTVGAAAALTCTIKALCCEEDEFIIFAPYFPEYTVFIQGQGGKVVTVSAQLPSFQMNLTELGEKINKNTKAVIINSPNNPSGAVYTAESLGELGEILRKKSAEYGHPIYLISDEPYRELVYDAVSVPWVGNYYENTLICYSFSKSLSLAGERIGYVLVGNQVEDWEEVYWAIAGAGRVLGYVNAPSLFQQVCSHYSHMTSDLDFYKTNRDILCQGLEACGFEITPPQGAFYLFPKALEEDDAAFCQVAREFDLLLVPSSSFGVKGYFRLSYCVSRQTVEGSLPQFAALAKRYGRN